MCECYLVKLTLSPSHGSMVSVTLTKSLDACPLPLQSSGVKVLSPASQAPLQEYEWAGFRPQSGKSLKYRLSANIVSALFSTCYNDALHYSLFVKMSLNL